MKILNFGSSAKTQKATKPVDFKSTKEKVTLSLSLSDVVREIHEHRILCFSASQLRNSSIEEKENWSFRKF